MDKVVSAALDFMKAQVGKAQYSRTKRMENGYFDCSSFVYRAYKAAGVKLTVEHSTSMYLPYAKEFRLLWPAKASLIGKEFAPKDILQQLGVSGGEHVFYNTDSSTTRFNKITHVSTVLSGGKSIVHARNTKDDVCVNDISYGSARICAVVEYIGEDTVPVISRVLYCKLPNMTGEDVRVVQSRLIGLGFSCGPKGADGEYGLNTEAAVNAYQKKHPECGTNGKPDGRVGPKTTRALGLVWKG